MKLWHPTAQNGFQNWDLAQPLPEHAEKYMSK